MIVSDKFEMVDHRVANLVAIMTRSRTKSSPNQYTAAPFPLKALKLILKELQSYKTTGAGKGKGKQVDNSALDNLDEDDGVSLDFAGLNYEILMVRMRNGTMMMIWEMRRESSTSYPVSLCILPHSDFELTV